MQYDVRTVDEYLSQLPAERKDALQTLRELILKLLPEAVEGIKYGHPTYDLDGPLVSLAAQKHYLALYVCETDAVERARSRLGKLSVGRSCIRFRKIEDLDLDLITEVILDAVRQREGTS